MESAYLLARAVMLTAEPGANWRVCAKYLKAARALAGAVPAFCLRVSLTGRFWSELERVLPPTRAHAQRSHCLPAITLPDQPNSEIPVNPETPVDACSKHLAADSVRPIELPSGPLSLHNLVLQGRTLRLVCFRARQRTFLKLMAGRRVVASANDTTWKSHVARPFRTLAGRRTARGAAGRASPK